MPESLERTANRDPLGTRRCSRCGRVSPADDFPFKDKAQGLRRSWCRDCCRAYGREHYARERESYRARTARRRAIERPRVRAEIDRYLRQHPCTDCGCRDIRVLEFDHVDPAEKSATVARLARSAEWPRVLAEIRKCVVRCANCHRRRTGEQFRHAKVIGVRLDPNLVRPGGSSRFRTSGIFRQESLWSAEVHGLRRCSRCRELKAVYCFPYQGLAQGSRGYYCRACHAAYRQAHYRSHRGDYMARALTEARLKREDILVRLFAYLREHPCSDCGAADIRVLEFDHRDGSGKAQAVANMIGRRSWATIAAEIAKCEVRCANCHRRRTAIQMSWKHRLGGPESLT